MRRFLVAALCAGALPVLAAGPIPRTARAAAPADLPAAPASSRVDSLLARMTLEEKVGQMTQLTLAVVAAEDGPQRDSVRIDPAKLREAIVERHVGSLLNVVGGSLSVEGWHRLMAEVQGMALRETRLGIPVIYGIDFVHGANYTRGGTIFPHNVGMAATFNPALARRAAEITADEALASGLPWNFAPVLDVGRNPLWPRFYETFGEDPLVATVLGRQQVLGMQREGRVAATLKHYLAYSASHTGRDRAPVELSARGVRENYLPPFAAAVRAGARSVMVNSAEIDGEPVHASRYWLTDVLRGELGFQGVIVTDWEDIYYLHTRHRVAPTIKDAVRMAVEAGIDVSMSPTDYRFMDALIELVREGAVSERRIDESVRRILTLKEALGLFDAPLPDPALRARFATEQSAEVARQAARESITLLKNEGGILPLKPDAKILVTGPAAQSMTALNGGWTYTWQGTDASQFPEAPRTVLEAILRRGRDVRYVAGSGFTEPGDPQAAARLAADADVAVVVIGENAYAEGVGDVADLTLPEAQLRLVEAVQATGTPVVLVLVEGRPRIIRRVVDGARGVVMAYWPGMQGGEAVAEVLFGETNPSGRLPFTYPRHPNELLTYDHKFTETLSPAFGGQGFRPEWPFGHGLSYTTFAYADLRLGGPRMDADGRMTVQVTVRNTGTRAGEETVLLYTRQQYASTTPYTRRLRGFQKVALAPGESRAVTFVLTADDLRTVGRDGRMMLEPGAFDVMVGGLTGTFQVTADAARTTTEGR
ncbi:glycoside hydrolase family 3 N-terminal domain-containing protein [Longimicrobium sp.]|uniref:glycoside hydrolase family 3 N-terminal domain-containing protein n=1 Tax=Longimicrobium sp. TaxID=2029185 RepID=UPI002E3479EE|nr:glycoside hydrolase family 3 N-terminal domain-containing protein [Longimicrobium sp.]HEX6037327.1 glycoside hydrolase family 3 N-terminal domain-containing protein [Longimicrobium sp.]